MGLRDVLQYFSRKSQEVYCQNCGEDITTRGGFITDSQKIYCYEREGIRNSCCINALMRGEEKGQMIANFYESQEVQRAIRRGVLIKFSPLEERVLY